MMILVWKYDEGSLLFTFFFRYFLLLHFLFYFSGTSLEIFDKMSRTSPSCSIWSSGFLSVEGTYATIITYVKKRIRYTVKKPCQCRKSQEVGV